VSENPSQPLRYLVMWLDYTGSPRAWGCSFVQADAERVAREQLEKYCAKAKAMGEVDMANPADYTMKIERCV
jgi:hypothetical protein